ncbi:helix-turn-helix domain-containing protein [Prauserella muralis]|uniref:Uncharacterized protein n=1 Tax=Prauserella muralis TaxID=588067 RepID=A0A2V4AZI0_9PSEU|nr:helix-turn-helix transcriptional regulator [Prauserella muralis]PXY27400.1 hypothetical protein BAY60_13275 [Prauserella muralis]TWE22904.1 hypothetical protein FHX69_4160 [Prauserella muralis]
MPKLNSERVKHRIAELGLSVEDVSVRTDIPYGTLRNAVAGRDPIKLNRAYRLLDALNPPGRARLVIADLLADTAAEKPAEPPQQPQGPKAPPRRQDNEQERKAPKRINAAVA